MTTHATTASQQYFSALAEHDCLMWQLRQMRDDLERRTPMDRAIDEATGHEAALARQATKMMRRIDKLNAILEAEGC
jgi:hypothetical protein